MHYYQDYKVFIPDTHFQLHQYGRPEGDKNPKNMDAKGDISGSSPQINWYINSTEKKIWLGKATHEGVGEVFHEVISNTLYRNVFSRKGTIKVPRAIASEVVIHEGVATHTHGLIAGTKSFSLMSKKVSEFHDFGPDLLKQLDESPRKPLTVQHPKDPSEKLPVNSLWTLAAYSKWFGDVDFIGRAGGNVGYQLKTNAEGEYYCKTVKIDPGFVGYGEESQPELISSKNITYSNAGSFIDIDTLLPEEKEEFFKTIQEITNYSDKEIEKLVSNFNTQGLSRDHLVEFNKRKNNLKELLIERRNQLKEVYKNELAELPPYVKEILPNEDAPGTIELAVSEVSEKVGVIWSSLTAGIGIFASNLWH